MALFLTRWSHPPLNCASNSSPSAFCRAAIVSLIKYSRSFIVVLGSRAARSHSSPPSEKILSKGLPASRSHSVLPRRLCLNEWLFLSWFNSSPSTARWICRSGTSCAAKSLTLSASVKSPFRCPHSLRWDLTATHLLVSVSRKMRSSRPPRSFYMRSLIYVCMLCNFVLLAARNIISSCAARCSTTTRSKRSKHWIERCN